MLVELFDRISAQAVAASKPQYVRPEAEPAHVYVVAGTDGQAVKFDADPAPRQHAAHDLTAIVDFAHQYAAPPSMKEGDRSTWPWAHVWYSRNAVVCLIDDETRRDRVTLKLEPSEPLRLLQAFAAQRSPRKQTDFLHLLKTTLKKTIPHGSTLIDAVARMQFKLGSTADAKLARDQRSIGKSLEQQVLGLEAVPEYVTFDVPVFRNAFAQHLRRPIECLLTTDAVSESLCLEPLPGEIEAALAAGESWLSDQLHEMLTAAAAETVPVHYGEP